eukprot:TRINITY_DN1116_c0_g1_i1.p2 TRINITY_DN1116_c0_g1~~TRINITY_DN1116_c0_g1_i1.p2  ORF type:complete len:114 (+),score=29.33 TRINITY_DN1116_c0_g1_i1:81-422(+)
MMIVTGEEEEEDTEELQRNTGDMVMDMVTDMENGVTGDMVMDTDTEETRNITKVLEEATKLVLMLLLIMVLLPQELTEKVPLLSVKDMELPLMLSERVTNSLSTEMSGTGEIK